MLLDAIDHHPDMGFLVNDVIISLCIRKKLSFAPSPTIDNDFVSTSVLRHFDVMCLLGLYMVAEK